MMDSLKPKPQHVHKKHHERPLPWISTPVSHEEHVPVYHEVAGKFDSIPIPLHASTAYTSLAETDSHSACPTRPHPVFKRHAEATPSELFYDLFFVANLTAFTAKHEINDDANLRSYIGFFALLWATWFNVSLYDLRLARDSVFDRICKAIQFGVMVGFVASGADFTPNTNHDGVAFGVFESGQVTSLLLMASRFTLTLQYGLSFWYLRNYHGAWAPMVMTIVTTFVSGLFYMAISFAFPPFTDDAPQAYIAWYFLLFVESAATVFASSRWRLLSFKGTHIVERLSLLTLIILGEGIIGLADTIHDALDYDLSGHVGTTTKSFNGGIVAVILLLYFLYMLYFDCIPEEHFGTIRSQIWALFHFPLHVALVLFVEGAAQSLRWRRIIQQTDIMADMFDNTTIWNDYQSNVIGFQNDTAYGFVGSRNTTEYFATAATELKGVFFNIYQTLHGADYEGYLEAVNDTLVIANGTNVTGIDVLAGVFDIVDKSYGLVMQAFGANPGSLDADTDGGDGDGTPQAGADTLDKVISDIDAYLGLFDLVFKYFFIAGGLTLILLGVLAMMGKKSRWSKWDKLRFASFFVCGFVLAMLALAVLEDGGDNSFGNGPMVIPVAAILVFVVVVVNHLWA